jgi:double-stranded uracil-DNA glycosylase
MYPINFVSEAGDFVIAHVLPDVLRPGLDIVFCGTAAGSASARRGAYYAGPGNAFWRTLHRVGLTSSVIEPGDFRRLVDWNMGFTDLVKTHSGADATLARTHFDVDRLRRLLEEFSPKILAFTGKRAAQEFIGHPVAYGAIPCQLPGAPVLWVLPSPSGAARRYWDEAPWRELARFRWTRIAAGEYHRGPTQAPVAQLDRVSASEAEGPAFESRRARQFPNVRVSKSHRQLHSNAFDTWTDA